MTLDEIKAAVDAGKTVFWASEAYRVEKDGSDYIIRCVLNQNVIGLTWDDGVTLNGHPNQFYIG